MSESVSRPKHDSMRRHDLGYFRLAATVPVQESARACACSRPGVGTFVARWLVFGSMRFDRRTLK